MISPTQRPLPDNTQHSQETYIHAAGGIRTHNPSKRAAACPRPRPGGLWDRRRKYKLLLLLLLQADKISRIFKFVARLLRIVISRRQLKAAPHALHNYVRRVVQHLSDVTGSTEELAVYIVVADLREIYLQMFNSIPLVSKQETPPTNSYISKRTPCRISFDIGTVNICSMATYFYYLY